MSLPMKLSLTPADCPCVGSGGINREKGGASWCHPAPTGTRIRTRAACQTNPAFPDSYGFSGIRAVFINKCDKRIVEETKM